MYLQNERLMKLQYKCIIFDGPCDIVGRWAKPRAKGLLLGRCDLCTETQTKWISEWYEILVDRYPDVYRAAIAKYLQNEGIEIDNEEKAKIEEAFKDPEDIEREPKSDSSNNIKSDTVAATPSSTISSTVSTTEISDESYNTAFTGNEESETTSAIEVATENVD